MEMQLGWACKLDRVEPLWISRVGHTFLARLMESQIWHQPTISVLGERSTKGQCPLFPLMPNTSVPPCIPLVPFKLPPWCWSSEGMSLNRWVRVWVPQEELLRVLQPPPLTQSPLVFTARSCGNLSSWHWNPGLGGLVWVWDYSLLRYPSQTCIYVDVGPHLYPSYQSGWMRFLQFHCCQTSIRLDFWHSWVLAVLHCSCTFDVLVWRGEPYLPTSPTWPEARTLLFQDNILLLHGSKGFCTLRHSCSLLWCVI